MKVRQQINKQKHIKMIINLYMMMNKTNNLLIINNKTLNAIFYKK